MTTRKKRVHPHMPAEFDRQTAMWLGWPSNEGTFCLKKAQRVIEEVARLICDQVAVHIVAPPSTWEQAQKRFQGVTGVYVAEVECNDGWMRDVAPTFLSNKSAISWKFTGWGKPRMIAHDKDALVAVKICNSIAYPCKRLNFVLEGGSIIVDGRGTLMATEETLLNKNRNPALTKHQIEQTLTTELGVSKVLWLPYGISGDADTNGHIDNMAIFYAPGKVLLTWPEGCGTGSCADPDQEMRSLAAMGVLEKATDARGRKVKVVKLPHPPMQFYTKEEEQEILLKKGSFARVAGTRIASSYINMIFCNDVIVVPTFNCHTDELALNVVKGLFPTKKVVGVYSRELNLGGGNIHCMSQQQP